MFAICLSIIKQQGFTTYLGPLKNCCPKFSHKFVCQKLYSAQSCQKQSLKTDKSYLDTETEIQLLFFVKALVPSLVIS